MNLDQIKGRCRIDEETGCWLWSGAMSTDAGGGRVPIVWHEGRASSALRVVYALSGRTVRKGEIVWRACRHDHCLNPAHLLSGTRKQWGAWRKANGFAAIRPEAWAASMLAKRKDGELDSDTVSMIRSSPETGAELARRLNVSKTAISRVRRWQTWAETVPQASVFTWRP